MKILAFLLCLPLPAFATTFSVQLADDLVDEPVDGRLVVMLWEVDENGEAAHPYYGSYFNPQPRFGMDVEDWSAGEVHVIDAADGQDAFPVALADLPAGTYDGAAFLDRNRITGEWDREPGNLVGPVVRFEAGDDVALVLDDMIRERPSFEREDVEEFTIESTMLSAFRGEPVTMNAAVIFPTNFDPDRKYPVVYTIPGFSGTHRSALRKAEWFAALRPDAFIIGLDPDSPNGHTLFVDSRVNGPCGTALVDELIPALEAKYPLIAEPWARVVTGHSSGGWSSLWLALEHPETFGACWSTGPDPVTFERFELIDVYTWDNAFVRDGEPVSAMREDGRSIQSVRAETQLEDVLGPDNASGQQWDSWQACWGTPSGDDPRVARPLFDPITGAIDPVEAEAYRAFDIVHRLRADPQRYLPIFAANVRLLCGEEDDYYLDEAVRLLIDELDKHELPEGPGYVQLVAGDHGQAFFQQPEMQAIPAQIAEHFEQHRN